MFSHEDKAWFHALLSGGFLGFVGSCHLLQLFELVGAEFDLVLAGPFFRVQHLGLGDPGHFRVQLKGHPDPRPRFGRHGQIGAQQPVQLDPKRFRFGVEERVAQLALEFPLLPRVHIEFAAPPDIGNAVDQLDENASPVIGQLGIRFGFALTACWSFRVRNGQCESDPVARDPGLLGLLNRGPLILKHIMKIEGAMQFGMGLLGEPKFVEDFVPVVEMDAVRKVSVHLPLVRGVSEDPGFAQGLLDVLKGLFHWSKEPGHGGLGVDAADCLAKQRRASHPDQAAAVDELVVGRQHGNATRDDSFLAPITIVGNDSRDPARAGTLGSIQEEEKLHQVVVGRRAGWLDNEEVGSPHVLLYLHSRFAVRKSFDGRANERNLVVLGDALGQLLVSGSGDYFKVVHALLF